MVLSSHFSNQSPSSLPPLQLRLLPLIPYLWIPWLTWYRSNLIHLLDVASSDHCGGMLWFNGLSRRTVQVLCRLPLLLPIKSRVPQSKFLVLAHERQKITQCDVNFSHYWGRFKGYRVYYFLHCLDCSHIRVFEYDGLPYSSTSWRTSITPQGRSLRWWICA